MAQENAISEQQALRALWFVVNEGMSFSQAARQEGISERSLFRYKKTKDIELLRGCKIDEVAGRVPVLPAEITENLNSMLERKLKIQGELMDVQELIVKQLKKRIPKLVNVDILQKALKTVNDATKTLDPRGDVPPVPKNVNIVNYFNQQVINEGDESKDITPADIVEND